MNPEDLKNLDLEELKNIDRPRIYVFSGRIYPERYQWGMSPPQEVISLHDDGTSALLKISINASQILVTVHIGEGKDLLDVKNHVTGSVRILADSMGFVHGAALDVEIIACTDPDGEHHVFNTAFDDILDRQPGSPGGIALFTQLIHHANVSPFVRMALADLRHAIREPTDTCVNCYRAVESIRHEYLDGPDTGAARRSSWRRLRDAVGVEEEDLRWLEERATPRRHGRAIDVTGGERQRAIRIARKIVQEHCLSHPKPTGPGREVVSGPSDDAPVGR